MHVRVYARGGRRVIPQHTFHEQRHDDCDSGDGAVAAELLPWAHGQRHVRDERAETGRVREPSDHQAREQHVGARPRLDEQRTERGRDASPTRAAEKW